MHLTRRSLLVLPMAAALPAPVTVQDTGDRPYWPTSNWSRSRPERQSMDPGLLAEADRVIAIEMPDITDLLVVRHGYVIPALDLIAVILAGFETPPQGTIHRPVIENLIVPAVIGDRGVARTGVLVENACDGWDWREGSGGGER